MNVDSQTLLALLGIGISIFLFLVGYRKTIGAKNARIQAANKRITDSLLKRLVLEDFIPRTDEIERFSSGMAAEYLLRTQDVLGTEDILDSLYAQILDNDFIGPDQRKGIVDKLRTLAHAEPERLPTPQVESSSTEHASSRSTVILLALASALTATATAFAIGILLKGEQSPPFSKAALFSVLTTLVISFSILIPILLLKKVKESQEETRPQLSITAYSDLEKMLMQALDKAGIPFERSKNAAYDFHLKGKDGDYFIELKASLRRIPPSLLRKIIERLESITSTSNAVSSFIISFEPLPDRVRSLGTEHVRILEFFEFKQLLKQLKP